MLGPGGAICLLAASVVLCTAGLRSDASRSAAAISFDDDEDGGGDLSSSFSFTFPDTGARGLAFGFYDEACPDAEEIVSSTVQRLYHADPNVAAALVRLFFHDCFIHVRSSANKLRRPECRL
jgi:peroxidase